MTWDLSEITDAMGKVLKSMDPVRKAQIERELFKFMDALVDELKAKRAR